MTHNNSTSRTHLKRMATPSSFSSSSRVNLSPSSYLREDLHRADVEYDEIFGAVRFHWQRLDQAKQKYNDSRASGSDLDVARKALGNEHDLFVGLLIQADEKMKRMCQLSSRICPQQQGIELTQEGNIESNVTNDETCQNEQDYPDISYETEPTEAHASRPVRKHPNEDYSRFFDEHTESSVCNSDHGEAAVDSASEADETTAPKRCLRSKSLPKPRIKRPRKSKPSVFQATTLLHSCGRTRAALNQLNIGYRFGMFAKFGQGAFCAKTQNGDTKISHLVLTSGYNVFARNLSEIQKLYVGVGERRLINGRALARTERSIPMFFDPQEAGRSIYYVGHWKPILSNTKEFHPVESYLGIDRAMYIELKFDCYDGGLAEAMQVKVWENPKRH